MRKEVKECLPTLKDVAEFLDECAQYYFTKHAQGFLDEHHGYPITPQLARLLIEAFLTLAIPPKLRMKKFPEFSVRQWIAAQFSRENKWQLEWRPEGALASIRRNRWMYDLQPRAITLNAKTLPALILDFINTILLPINRGTCPRDFRIELK